MTVEQMREKIASVYQGPKWRLKCQEMPENQVIAIFRSMVEKPRKPVVRKHKEPGVKKAVQLSIFDLPDFKEVY